MKILYLGWISEENIGDKLMFDNFKTLVLEKLGEDIEVDGFYCEESFDGFEPYDLVCLGGGSIFFEGFINLIYKALKLGKKVMIWGSGFDGIVESEIMKKLENSKSPAYIFKDETIEKINEIAKEAIFFGVRGPLTYKILEKSYVDMNNIIISGDPGLLLEGSSNYENKYFNSFERVVAINTGTSYNKIYGGNEEDIEKALLKLSLKLLDSGYKIYFYSMWPSDNDKILSLYNKLPKSSNVILDLSKHDATELVNILGDCLFSINFKLHGNIISLKGKTPFIGLGYRFKYYDLFNSINSENFNVITDSNDIESEIEKRILLIEKNNYKIEEKTFLLIEKYKELLRNSLNNY